MKHLNNAQIINLCEQRPLNKIHINSFFLKCISFSTEIFFYWKYKGSTFSRKQAASNVFFFFFSVSLLFCFVAQATQITNEKQWEFKRLIQLKKKKGPTDMNLYMNNLTRWTRTTQTVEENKTKIKIHLNLIYRQVTISVKWLLT